MDAVEPSAWRTTIAPPLVVTSARPSAENAMSVGWVRPFMYDAFNVTFPAKAGATVV